MSGSVLTRPAFAVESIRRWWCHLGKERHPRPAKYSSPPTATAPTGAASGCRRWSCRSLHANSASRPACASCRPAPANGSDRTRILLIHKPELARQPPVHPHIHHQPDRPTTTGTGLRVYCDRNTNKYPTGIKISKSETQALDIRRTDFHGDRNHTLLPNPDNVAVMSSGCPRSGSTTPLPDGQRNG